MSSQLRKVDFYREGHKGCRVLRPGKKLGEGAHSVTYSLKDKDGEDSDWCLKLTSIADGTESLVSADEKKEHIHRYEQNQLRFFQSLLEGGNENITPRLPEASGETASLKAVGEDAKGMFGFVLGIRVVPRMYVHMFVCMYVCMCVWLLIC